MADMTRVCVQYKITVALCRFKIFYFVNAAQFVILEKMLLKNR